MLVSTSNCLPPVCHSLTRSIGFLSSQWHIRSEGTFAVTCIAVVLMVVMLEFLRRAGKEYDAFILRQFRQQVASRPEVASTSVTPKAPDENQSGSSRTHCSSQPIYLKFRPTLLQQIIRSVIHMCTFGVAYIIMLLAMCKCVSKVAHILTTDIDRLQRLHHYYDLPRRPCREVCV
jgi:hypothetical protein